MKKILLLVIIIFAKVNINASKFTVINTKSNGAGSLRSAIDSCLLNPGLDTIDFNIPVSDKGFNQKNGVWIIVLNEMLTPISTDSLLIDGFSQTNNQGDKNIDGPEIYISGNNNSVEVGFSIMNASNITIRGFIISEFLYGIQVFGRGSKNIIITGNYIGTDAKGIERKRNYVGVELLSGANNNTIGGKTLIERNLISGNEYAGIRISDADSNIIIGNYVGVDRTGKFSVYNYDGITIEGTSRGNRIGGRLKEERNITSGNIAYGIDVFGAGAKYNLIQGNYIGTDESGNYAIPNTYGILFDDRSSFNQVGGRNPGEGNLISGNTAFGAYFYNNGTNNNYLIGNFIGTDATGIFAIPNETGVHIDGATYSNLIDSNLISGNSANGITIFATNTNFNIIIKNKIGTDVSGAKPLGNGFDGIRITQGPAYNFIGGSPQTANIIAFNGRNGVSVESEKSDYNLISCNSIFQNGNLGIDLSPDGITFNDAGDSDFGPNDNLNYPYIIKSYFDDISGKYIINGYLDTKDIKNSAIEIYLADYNEKGIGQGKKYISTTFPNENGFWSDSVLAKKGDSIIALTAQYYKSDISPLGFYGNSSEFSPSFNIIQNINENLSTEKIIISPNPASGYIEIHLDNIILSEAKNPVKIYNTYGECVITVGSNCNEPLQRIDISHLPAGVYLLRIGQQTAMFVKI